MQLKRAIRRVLSSRIGTFAALGLIGLAIAASPVPAQEWPSRPIRVVIPFAAGSVAEPIFRAMASSVEARLRQPFVLDNRAGADGNIGTAAVVRAAPDGYTLLMAPTANYSVVQHMFKDLGFDPITALEPISLLAEAPILVVVEGNVPAKSLKELADFLRANPRKYNYGSPGVGTPAFLVGTLFSQQTGNSMVYIPYKGTSPMVTAILAGDIQVAFPSLPAVSSQLKSGRIRVLSVLARQRMAEIPDVPTTVEAGFPQLVMTNWWVLSAPSGTNPRIIERLASEFRDSLGDPEVRKRVAQLGHFTVGMSPSETAAFIRSESVRYKTILDSSGIKPE
jgi:tripartite-type tricarboxylate transporter receptor subunit TctC